MLHLPGCNERRLCHHVADRRHPTGARTQRIAVSPLSYPEGYAAALELAAKHARLLVVETVLDEAEWRRRLDARRPGTRAQDQQLGDDAGHPALRGCWRYPIDPAQHAAGHNPAARDVGKPGSPAHGCNPPVCYVEE